IAGWSSGITGGKYTGGGNGDHIVQANELVNVAPWPFAAGFSGGDTSSSTSATRMIYPTPHTFPYRFGIKTRGNHLPQTDCAHNQVPELAATPEMPLGAVKGAVQVLADTLTTLQSNDQLSLEIFATTDHHMVDLTTNFQTIADQLDAMQSGHFDTCTDIAG